MQVITSYYQLLPVLLKDSELSGPLLAWNMVFYRLSWIAVSLLSNRFFKTCPWAVSTLRLRDIPNLITGLRLLLAVPIVWLLLEERYREALLLFVIAGISDLVDGFLAKNYGWTSKLGSILDPLADKLLLVGTLLVLGWQGEVPVWLVSLAVGRDVMLVSLAVGYHYMIEPVKAEPLLISKLNTLLQLALVAVVLFSKAVLALPEALLILLIYGAGLTTLWSGCAYLWEWGQRAWHRVRRPPVS